MASLSCGRFAVELDAVADVTTSSFCTFCDTSLQISMAQSTQGTTCWIFHEKTLTGRICFFLACWQPCIMQKAFWTKTIPNIQRWRSHFLKAVLLSMVPSATSQHASQALCILQSNKFKAEKSNLELPQNEQNSTRVLTRKTIHSSVRHQHKITDKPPVSVWSYS